MHSSCRHRTLLAELQVAVPHTFRCFSYDVLCDDVAQMICPLYPVPEFAFLQSHVEQLLQGVKHVFLVGEMVHRHQQTSGFALVSESCDLWQQPPKPLIVILLEEREQAQISVTAQFKHIRDDFSAIRVIFIKISAEGLADEICLLTSQRQ